MYRKPSINVLGSALEQIQGSGQLPKSGRVNDNAQVPSASAYEADE